MDVAHYILGYLPPYQLAIFDVKGIKHFALKFMCSRV